MISEWIICPICGNKTRDRVREDTVLRPVLIISNDVGNKHSPTVIVAPITSRIHTKAKLPTHTLINDFEGLDKNSIILFEQIRTIDKQRLRKYVGMLSTVIMARADKALAISISLREVNNE